MISCQLPQFELMAIRDRNHDRYQRQTDRQTNNDRYRREEKEIKGQNHPQDFECVFTS